MAINVTPIPKLAGFAAPAFTLGTANTAGSATTAVASNSTLLAFDAVVPTSIAYSASAAAGSAVVSAKRDHSHGMVAAPSLTTQYIGGSVAFNGEGTIAIRNSYNVSSIEDNGGAGDYDVHWNVDMPAATYPVATSVGMNGNGTCGLQGGFGAGGMEAATVRVATYVGASATDVAIVSVIAFLVA